MPQRRVPQESGGTSDAEPDSYTSPLIIGTRLDNWAGNYFGVAYDLRPYGGNRGAARFSTQAEFDGMSSLTQSRISTAMTLSLAGSDWLHRDISARLAFGAASQVSVEYSIVIDFPVGSDPLSVGGPRTKSGSVPVSGSSQITATVPDAPRLEWGGRVDTQEEFGMLPAVATAPVRVSATYTATDPAKVAQYGLIASVTGYPLPFETPRKTW
jgi:hypothetical protein